MWHKASPFAGRSPALGGLPSLIGVLVVHLGFSESGGSADDSIRAATPGEPSSHGVASRRRGDRKTVAQTRCYWISRQTLNERLRRYEDQGLDGVARPVGTVLHPQPRCLRSPPPPRTRSNGTGRGGRDRRRDHRFIQHERFRSASTCGLVGKGVEHIMDPRRWRDRPVRPVDQVMRSPRGGFRWTPVWGSKTALPAGPRRLQPSQPPARRMETRRKSPRRRLCRGDLASLRMPSLPREAPRPASAGRAAIHLGTHGLDHPVVGPPRNGRT